MAKTSASQTRKAVRPVVKKMKTVPAKLLKKGTVAKAAVRRATSMTKEQWDKIQSGIDAKKWQLPAYMNGEKGHMKFKEETFSIITRWTATTKIQYRPHAKAPGSKSHLRYEEYSKAKTVGQALEFGTYPCDWCWDYERGFIKVIGGEIRDEPIDATKVKSEGGKVTPVDEAIHTWVKKELARKLGMKPEELAKSAGYSESLSMRGHRLLAQNEAKATLENADSQGRIVTDEEVLSVLKKWTFAKNPFRQNVMREGQTWVFSDTLGLLRDRCGDIHRTASTRRYPQVTELFARWLTDRLPPDAKDFTFTSMNVNCNYAAALHRDQGNFGPSFIKAFGDFGGGELNYWPEDTGGDLKKLPPKGKGSVSLNLKEGLALFNGNCAHSVNDFTGSRYSIVYFTVSCYPQALEEDKAKLKQLKIAYPGPKANPYNILRAPHGYSSQSKKKDSKPAWLYWPRSALEKGRKGKSPAEVKKNAALLKKNRLAPETQRSFYTHELRAEKRAAAADADYGV